MAQLYQVLAARLQAPAPVGGLWATLRERLNPALHRPRRDPVAERHVVHDPGRPPYVVLSHPHLHAYARLSPEEAALWDLMDGSRSVRDLILAHFAQTGTLALGLVAGLVAHLHQLHLLADKPTNVYGLVLTRLGRRRRLRWWAHTVLQTLTGRPFRLRGVDPWVDWIYRAGGWLAYTRPAQVLWALLGGVGAVLFVEQLRSGRFAAGAGTAGGVALFFVLNYVAIAVHEAAHALTVRHHGARVNGAGFVLYLGLPSFFVDTTDIWTRPLRARLATSWAGPYSGFVLAGALSLLITLVPGLPAADVLHRLALVWMLMLLFNLIPFVELDGYYMLVDWLDLPRLRARALAFVRRDLWRKLRAREAFTPHERLLAGYGVLAVVVTALLVLVGITVWQTWLGTVFRSLWAAGPAGRGLAALLALVFFVPLLVGLVSSVASRARAGVVSARRWWDRPRTATVRDRLALLDRAAFLAAVPAEVRREVAHRLRPLRVRAGQTVFRQGESGDAFYLIREGVAEVVQTRDGVERRLTRLGPGEHFGEIALLGRTTRTATVRAVEPLDLLVLRRGDFDRLLAPHVQASAAVERAIREHEDLRALPLFAALPPAELAALADHLRREVVPPGQEVVRQGEVGDRFYVIQSGQAEVVRAADGRAARIRMLGPGDHFGEIALLGAERRTATVRALTPLVLRSLDRSGFESLLVHALPAIAQVAAARREAAPTPGDGS